MKKKSVQILRVIKSILLLVASIVDIYNINDLQDKLLNQQYNVWYGVVFAVVTSFDIDDDESKCVVTRWYVFTS